MSQTYQKERREKFTTGASGLAMSGLIVLSAAGDIGDLPPSERGAAWSQFWIAALVVAVPTLVMLWRLTPWPEIPDAEKKFTLSSGLTLAAGGSIMNFFLQKDPNTLRMLIGGCVGLFVGLSIAFLLVGLTRKWISKDATFRD
jgi:hypothetical protein